MFVRGASPLLLLLGALQLPGGEQAWVLLLHSEEKRPVPLPPWLPIKSLLLANTCVSQPGPTGHCLAEPGPNRRFPLKA